MSSADRFQSGRFQSGRFQSGRFQSGRFQSGRFLAALAALCVVVFGLAGRGLDAPGLYYDEVIQALPAAEFLREGGRALEIPGARSEWLFGGWFPLMTQPYMGALKSQLLIPVFALAPPSPELLRATTLAWSCLGLLLFALWARRLYGPAAALLAAGLLAVDPSFLFVGRHDWGSVALALALRAGGLLLLTSGWQRDRSLPLFCGGLLLGLGVFNKIDLAAFLAGCGLALALLAPPTFWRALRARPVRGAAALLGVLLGSAPMWLTLPRVFGATRALLGSQAVRPDHFAEKLGAWSALLDGSYFHRLMLSGGSFERMHEVDAVSGVFGSVFALAALGLAVAVVHEARRGPLDRPAAFALLATLGVGVALLLIPRAARIHHVMNVQPLPQLVVALAVVRAWRRGGATRWLAVVAATAALLGSVRVDVATLRSIDATGGRGRWSGALEALARELPDGTPVVSLDWGFHAPLRLLHPELALSEPIWTMHRPPDSRRTGFALAGGPRHLYLVWEPGYEVFGVGQQLLDAVEALPEGSAVVRRHASLDGEPAFRSVRFARPHQLVYRGSFEVKLQ